MLGVNFSFQMQYRNQYDFDRIILPYRCFEFEYSVENIYSIPKFLIDA